MFCCVIVGCWLIGDGVCVLIYVCMVLCVCDDVWDDVWDVCVLIVDVDVVRCCGMVLMK